MTGHRFGRLQKAITLVPLAALSAAWTASLAGVGATTSAVASDPTLPDGTSVPAEAIEDPASYTQPGRLGLGVRGSEASIVQAASVSGIPSAALAAYQRAENVINSADPGCNISWQLLAAIGRVESDHGRYAGNRLGDDGVSRPGIFGVALDGSNGTQAIRDTDAGQYDSDGEWDRAVGPMQFIPSTWSVVGVDADADGKRNPQDIDDAALAAAVYLCSGDDDLSTEEGQRAAVYRYNHSQAYVDLVLRIMDAYLTGDYSSVPNATTSAAYFQPSYDYARPVLTPKRPARPAAQPTRGSGPQPAGGGSGPSSPPPSKEQPKETVEPPSAPTSEGPVRKTTDTVEDTTKETTKTVVDTLSYAEALNLCESEFAKIDDPLGQLNGLADDCARRVEGETREKALAIIPNTLPEILAWLT